jgi:zinc transport system substrate-binding protein
MDRIFSVLFFLITFLSSAAPTATSEAFDKIGVFVSILPQKEFAERIGGNKVDVSVMVPPGANPHSYEPRPSQLTFLAKARIYIKVGTPIEFELAWFDKLRKMNPSMFIIDMSHNIRLEGNDPHIWLSPRRAETEAKNIYSGFVEEDPANAGYYRRNLDHFIGRLKTLDSEIKGMFSGKKKKIFMVFHPSFAYFSNDYGLTEVPIENEGKEPTAKELKRLIDTAKADEIRTIFVSPEFSARSAEVIAGQIGAKVRILDPLAENYFENLKTIALAISGSMR